MNARQKNSSLTPKKAAKAASSYRYACRLCGINFKISVSDFGNRTNIFQPERAGVEKIGLADLLKIHVGIHVELDPQVGKSSCECSCLNTNPPRQEAHRRSKRKHSEILLKSMLFWPELQSDEWHFCHSSCQRSAMLWWTLLFLTPIRCCCCWSN